MAKPNGLLDRQPKNAVERYSRRHTKKLNIIHMIDRITNVGSSGNWDSNPGLVAPKTRINRNS